MINYPSLSRIVLVLGLKVLSPRKPLSPRKTVTVSHPINHTRYSLYRLCWWTGPFCSQMPNALEERNAHTSRSCVDIIISTLVSVSQWQKFDKDNLTNKALNFKSIKHRTKACRDKLSAGRKERKVSVTSISFKNKYHTQEETSWIGLKKAKRTHLWL